MNIFKDYRLNKPEKPIFIDPKLRKKMEYEKRGFNLSHGKGKSVNKRKKAKRK